MILISIIIGIILLKYDDNDLFLDGSYINLFQKITISVTMALGFSFFYLQDLFSFSVNGSGDDFFLGSVFFAFLPIFVQIVLLQIRLLWHYTLTRFEIPKVLLQRERLLDSRLANVSTSENLLELVRAVSALNLHRYSRDRSLRQPIIPNGNLGIIVSFTTLILIPIITISVWVAANLNLVTDLIQDIRTVLS